MIRLVCVIGSVRAVGDDEAVVEIPSASQRRLLALLALHSPQRLRTERLADVLGISPGALRRSISRLRTVLGPEILTTATTGYALACPVDATRFADAVAQAGKAEDDDRIFELDRALEHWSGSARVLEEFEAEEWARGEIARLTEIHGAAIDDLCDEFISQRRAEDAIARLLTQIDRYPYRDRSRGLLVRALALAGRQADALREFNQYRNVLADELGTEPSPEVVRIERRVATGWDGINSSVSTNEIKRPNQFTLPGAFVRKSLFIGRSIEHETMLTELQLTDAGLRTVFVTGEAGMGKTVLLAELARSAETLGASVLAGTSDETGGSLEPFRTILNACIEHADQSTLNEHVARCGGELARLCPRLLGRVPTSPVPTDSDDATERFLMFEAAADILRRIAERGRLVLMLDDVQWAEPTALLLLRHLVRSLAGAPVLLVVSRRDPGESVSDELRAALVEIERGQARHLTLEAFGSGEIQALISGLRPSVPDESSESSESSESITQKLLEETAGNPLFATEVIRHWDNGRPEGAPRIPPSLREVLWSRVHTLGEETADVLATASVLGTEFQEDLLIQMVDISDADARRAIDSAVTAGLLVEVSAVRRILRFAHELIASALYEEIGSATGARLHERAVRVLSKIADEPNPDMAMQYVAVQLARHSRLAGMGSEAIHWSTVAGEEALRDLSPIEAAGHYEGALETAREIGRPLDEQADLLVRFGEAQHVAGEASALDTLGQGATMALKSGNNPALIRAALASDRGFMRTDAGAPEYLAMVEAAVDVVDPSDASTFARLLGLLSQSLVYTPQAARRTSVAYRALALSEEVSDPTLLARVAPGALAAIWAPGSAPVRKEIAARAVASAASSGDPKLEFRVRVVAFNVAVESGDAALAAHHLARIRATARSVGEPRIRWIAGLYDTFNAMMAGDLDEAEALASQTLDVGTGIGEPDAFTFFAGQYFVIGTFAGKHEQLLPVVEQLAKDNPGFQTFELAHAIVCAAVGNEKTARNVLSRGVSNIGDIPADNLWMTTVIGYSVLAIELNDARAAATLLPVIEPFAPEVAFSGATSQGPVSAYVGKLSSLLGRHEEAEDYLRVALSQATGFGWNYHRATTLVALVQARYRARKKLDQESSSWLDEASDLCRRFGFRSWMRTIDQLVETTAQP